MPSFTSCGSYFEHSLHLSVTSLYTKSVAELDLCKVLLIVIIIAERSSEELQRLSFIYHNNYGRNLFHNQEIKLYGKQNILTTV